MTGPLRVLVVDDSAYNRRNIADILGGSDEVEVVGKAADGEEALRLALQLKPDVITLDLEMPRMDGFTFLRILMARQPTPVIVVSSYSQKENVFKALELGAIDFVAKPEQRYSFDGPIRREILQKVRLIRSLRPMSFRPMPQAASALVGAAPIVRGTDSSLRPPQANLRYLIGIASSTGGPSAVLELVSRIPDRFTAAIVIAQHMPDKFTKTFAERLDKKGNIRVSEAMDNDQVLARKALVCPGRNCMEVIVGAGGGIGLQSDLRIRLAAPNKTDRYVPSGDRLFRSIAQVAGSRAVGIILTGMGDDGTKGARAILDAGGTVIAESEETAVVYGMPGSAVRAGAVTEVLPLGGIGDYLAGIV